MNNGTLLILHDESHADLATPGTRVACLNFWLERELTSRSIDFISLGDYSPDYERAGEITTAVRDAAREWYRLPAMRFFEHKDIRIGEAFEPMVDIYLGRLAYWRYALERVLDASSGITELVIPHSEANISITAGALASFEMRVVVDAARSIAEERGLAFRALGEASQPPERLLDSRSLLQEAVVAFYNAVIRFAPKRPLKIFASEYWRNVAPFIEHMDDVELVLMERSEFRAIPWKHLWRHRVRFMHPRAVVRSVAQRTTRSAAEQFRAAWPAASKTLEDWHGWKSASVSWKIVKPALDYLVETYAERIVADIEGLEHILAHERPNKVLLRASIGERQPHFFLAARIARYLGIPSIEQQHAGAFVDPRSAHSRLETDSLASYGPYESEWGRRANDASKHFVPVGSPRFDRYITERAEAQVHGRRLLQEAGLDPARSVLLAAVREEGIGFGTDSYVLADFFRAVASVQARVPELQIVFKFRPGHTKQAPRAFVQEILPEAVCMAREDLFSLICASSMVVCGNSSVIYETLIASKPLLLHPWQTYDAYHAQMYTPAAPIVYKGTELAGAVAHILTNATYRQELLARGQDFLKGYSFDGKSAERMAALLRSTT